MDEISPDSTQDPNVLTLEPYYVPQNNVPSTGSSIPTNPLTGFVGKAADTFLDALSFKYSGKQAPGAVYPTGQEDPNAVRQAQLANQQMQVSNLKPVLIYGGAIVASVVILLLVLRRK